MLLPDELWRFDGMSLLQKFIRFNGDFCKRIICVSTINKNVEWH